jgi:hypothetical protein
MAKSSDNLAAPSPLRLRSGPTHKNKNAFQHTAEVVRRAFVEFLTIPTLVIVAFLTLAGLMIWLDELRIQNGWPSIVPGTHDSIQTLLGTIATSIITVTSITFSLLLVAVQQGAAALTSQVYDQFLRRRANQAYFGFFVGLALYCLVTLAAVHPDYTPVYGAITAFLLTAVALYLLILLIYSTIDQMRPVAIVKSIREHVEGARSSQRQLLNDTWGYLPSDLPATRTVAVAPTESGYLTRIDVEALRTMAECRVGALAVIVLRSVGDYLSPGEELLKVHFRIDGEADEAPELLLSAVQLDDQRDLDSDPAYGIEQLATIGWTSTSTAKSNPHPGMLACWNLQDLVGRWYGPGSLPIQRSREELPVVYTDNVPVRLLAAFETLTVVASESMQHQTLAAVYRALAFALRYVPPELVSHVGEIVSRSLSALADHVPTAELHESAVVLIGALQRRGLIEVSGQLRAAWGELAKSIGTLHSRATRSSLTQTANRH